MDFFDLKTNIDQKFAFIFVVYFYITVTDDLHKEM